VRHGDADLPRVAGRLRSLTVLEGAGLNADELELRDDDPDIALTRVLRDDGTADPATDPRLPGETLLRAYREMRG